MSRSGCDRQNPQITSHKVDLLDEQSIEFAATQIADPLDLIFVATGLLHSREIKPEKAIRDFSAENFDHLFKINTIGPALIAKHFLPRLNRKSRSILAALSARVGSIEDNRLGGWTSYRASKAALNMVIKNASIELARKNKHAIVVGLHPGTVDSGMSKPFQQNVPEGKLFSPRFASEKLLSVIENLDVGQSGGLFDWRNEPIPF